MISYSEKTRKTKKQSGSKNQIGVKSTLLRFSGVSFVLLDDALVGVCTFGVVDGFLAGKVVTPAGAGEVATFPPIKVGSSGGENSL